MSRHQDKPCLCRHRWLGKSCTKRRNISYGKYHPRDMQAHNLRYMCLIQVHDTTLFFPSIFVGIQSRSPSCICLMYIPHLNPWTAWCTKRRDCMSYDWRLWHRMRWPQFLQFHYSQEQHMICTPLCWCCCTRFWN